jgi:transcriptional regulator with XRE-family HTH domain
MPPRRRVKPRSATHAALGTALRELREEAGLTQEQLGDRVGTEFNRIGEVERGVANPTLTTLMRLANGLGVPLREIVGRFERILDETTTEPTGPDRPGPGG